MDNHNNHNANSAMKSTFDTFQVWHTIYGSLINQLIMFDGTTKKFGAYGFLSYIHHRLAFGLYRDALPPRPLTELYRGD